MSGVIRSADWNIEYNSLVRTKKDYPLHLGNKNI